VLGVASGYDLLAVDATPGRLDAPLDPGDLFPPVNLCAPGAHARSPVAAPALRGPAWRHNLSGSPAGHRAERGARPCTRRCVERYGGNRHLMWSNFGALRRELEKRKATHVGDVMREAVTIDEGLSLSEAADLIVQKKANRLARPRSGPGPARMCVAPPCQPCAALAERAWLPCVHRRREQAVCTGGAAMMPPHVAALRCTCHEYCMRDRRCLGAASLDTLGEGGAPLRAPPVRAAPPGIPAWAWGARVSSHACASAAASGRALSRQVVVDEQGRLAGVLSRGDVLRAVINNFNIYMQSTDA